MIINCSNTVIAFFGKIGMMSLLYSPRLGTVIVVCNVIILSMEPSIFTMMIFTMMIFTTHTPKMETIETESTDDQRVLVTQSKNIGHKETD